MHRPLPQETFREMHALAAPHLCLCHSVSLMQVPADERGFTHSAETMTSDPCTTPAEQADSYNAQATAPRDLPGNACTGRPAAGGNCIPAGLRPDPRNRCAKRALRSTIALLSSSNCVPAGLRPTIATGASSTCCGLSSSPQSALSGVHIACHFKT